MIVGCELELLWAGAEAPEECPGEALVHVLYANGAVRGACAECLKLTLVQRAVTDGRGTALVAVALHPLTSTCAEDHRKWRDRACM